MHAIGRISAALAAASLATGALTSQELGFEPNLGQTDATVRFLERGPGHTLFFLQDEIVFSTAAGVVRLSFPGSEQAHQVEPERLLAGTSHYLKGKPEDWLPDVPRFGQVRYLGLYPGIDALFHGDPERLEFDFELAAGVSPAAVRLRLSGPERLELAADGELLAHLPAGVLPFSAPRAFQVSAGRELPVEASFELHDDGSVGFRVGPHDPDLPLVIDPVLLYASFLGGSDIDVARGVVVAEGYAYVAGWTASVDFPVQDSIKVPPTGDFDAYVAKLDDSGRGIVFATYIGGSSSDFGTDVAVDSAGNVYLTGGTLSADFPTESAFQPLYGGGRDAFVVKLTPSGNRMLYATFLGGTGFDQANAIAVDAFQLAHVAGTTASPEFPVLAAVQPVYGGGSFLGDAFLSGFDAAGALSFSTFAGGAGDDQGRDVALDPSGKIALVGTTTSDDLPVVSAFQPLRGGGNDAFVMKLSAKAAAVEYATYLGGDQRDFASGVAFDSLGNPCVVGDTSSPDFPTLQPLQAELNGFCDAFVTILKDPGELVSSTYLGGPGIDAAFRVAVDAHDNPVIVGETFSRGFPTRFAAQRRFGGGGGDGFVTRLATGGSALAYSSYLGGGGFEFAADVACDLLGTATVVGEGTQSETFPQVLAFQDGFGGGPTDAFIARMCLRPRVCGTPFHARSATAPVPPAPRGTARATVRALRSGGSPLDPPRNPGR